LSFVSRAQAALATKARGAHFDEATDEPIRDRVAAGPGPPGQGMAPAASPRLDGYQYHEITTHKLGRRAHHMPRTSAARQVQSCRLVRQVPHAQDESLLYKWH
jgi:hypothetical protein